MRFETGVREVRALACSAFPLQTFSACCRAARVRVRQNVCVCVCLGVSEKCGCTYRQDRRLLT